tara:strand:+ start:757 stop:999 length:243 start_codon:yes stop_codon:yes gene_type:complete
MSKHIIKALEQELETTRIACSKQNLVLSKIEEWLEHEVDNTELNDEKLCETNDDFIHFGRRECAESLLEQIEKWENPDDC